MKRQLREHRGALRDSLATTITFDGTAATLAAVVSDRLGYLVGPDSLLVEFYGPDERIGWDTWIVQIEGYGVFGFLDGPLASEESIGHAVLSLVGILAVVALYAAVIAWVLSPIAPGAVP